MVQIKFAVAFVLTAAAIGHVVALPLKFEHGSAFFYWRTISFLIVY